MKELVGKLYKLFTTLYYIWVGGWSLWLLLVHNRGWDDLILFGVAITIPFIFGSIVWWLLPNKWKEKKIIKEKDE